MPVSAITTADSVLSAADVRTLDAWTIEHGTPGIELMERAGRCIADFLLDPHNHGPAVRLDALAEGRRLLVLAGAGNNGGDGFVVARLLAAEGYSVAVALVSKAPREGGDAATNLARWTGGGGEVVDGDQALAWLGPDSDRSFDAVLDAVFGTGLDRSVDGALAELFAALADSDLPTVSVDVPSGLDADRGEALGRAVLADHTVTLGAAKPGLFLAQGPDHCGRVVVADIGLAWPEDAGLVPLGAVLTAARCQSMVPKRSPSTHKGTRGHLLCIGGSPGKSGAIAMTARAALRAGAGLVTIACPAAMLGSVDAALPESMTFPLPSDREGELSPEAWATIHERASEFAAVVVGPGLGQGEHVWLLLRDLLSQFDGPLVVDADAINTLVQHSLRAMVGRRRARELADVIFTPHPGEMARMCGKSAADVQADRLGSALTFCESHPSTVVLKGAATIVTDGESVAFNTSGNPGMATAGMGDVLAGIIGANLAAGIEPIEAAELAVFAHGLAADLLYQDFAGPGFLASEVADRVPSALNLLAT